MGCEYVCMTSWLDSTTLADTGDTPNYESIEDTLIDLANYAIIGLLVQRGQWEGIPNAQWRNQNGWWYSATSRYRTNMTRAVDATLRLYSGTINPIELWCVGDELDAPEPSRWNKGMAGEYAETLQDSIDLTHDIMARYRKALGNKPFYIQRSVTIQTALIHTCASMRQHLCPSSH
jgi:hypothetical protein